MIKKLAWFTAATAPAWGYALFLRPQMIKWGTRLGESQRRLPGDEIIPETNLYATRAIDINAPPEVVWPWIGQMGRDRTGWYGIDLIDNAGIPSATYIRSDLSPPQVGLHMDNGYEILQVEPERLLLCGSFGQAQFGIRGDYTLLFLLERRQGNQTRLLVRRRGYSYGFIGKLQNYAIFEVLDFLSGIKQLHNVRDLAQAFEAKPIKLKINGSSPG